jgi:hypothetical protein
MLAVNFVPVDCTGSPQCLSCFFVMQDSSRSVHILVKGHADLNGGGRET